MKQLIRLTLSVFLMMLILGLSSLRAEESFLPGQVTDSETVSAMESMYKEIASPSEAHKALANLVGTWNHTAIYRMSPNEPSISMAGTTDASLIFDGRYLMQQVHGDVEVEGQPPFEGIGVTGYDNLRSEYQSVWFDNMSTGINTGTGELNDETVTLSEEGDFSCPLAMEAHRKFRADWKIVDKNNIIYKNYMHAPDGGEFLAMEIRYTRNL